MYNIPPKKKKKSESPQGQLKQINHYDSGQFMT